MRRQSAHRILTAGLVALASLTVLTAPTSAAGSENNRELAAARAATARYHDEAAAIAAGYQHTDECVAAPPGAMGYHYVSPTLFDPLDVTRPGAVLYAPGPHGRRLVAVEYFVVDRDQNPATDDDRPSLFGQPFDGPMPGHFPGMPVHYDLHVWLWAHNPDGMFAQWNPSISC